MHDTDHLSMNEILRTRSVSADVFIAANEDYVKRSRLLEDVNRYDIFPSNSAAATAELTNAVLTGVNNESTIRRLIREFDRVEMICVFNELNKHANLPLILNVNASRTIQHFDVDAVAHADDETLMRSSYNFDSLDNGKTVAGCTVAVPAWTPMQLYVRYAYALFRSQSLEPIAHVRTASRYSPCLFRWEARSRPVAARRICLLMHTLCALSVARRNVYLNRLLGILKNFSFFVWCGECSQHWLANGGNEYFDLYSKFGEHVHERLPIDIVMARCHNTVATNGRLNRRLSAWILAQIVIDYREFVDRLVLRRRPRICNRLECSDETRTTAIRFFMRPFYTGDNILSLAPAEVLRVARGEWLLSKLWREIDFNVPIGAL